MLMFSDEQMTEIMNRLETIENKLDRLQVSRAVSDLVGNAQLAQDIFYRKVHELRSIEEKRDGIINALCQKIEMIHNKFEELRRD